MRFTAKRLRSVVRWGRPVERGKLGLLRRLVLRDDEIVLVQHVRSRLCLGQLLRLGGGPLLLWGERFMEKGPGGLRLLPIGDTIGTGVQS